MRMAGMRVTPDRVGTLGLEKLECDGAHRCHGRELDEPLRLSVGQSARDTRKRVEARDQEVGGAFGAALGRHETAIFAFQSDVSCYGWTSRAQTFSSSRVTCASAREAAKFSAPAANTFAPAAVS